MLDKSANIGRGASGSSYQDVSAENSSSSADIAEANKKACLQRRYNKRTSTENFYSKESTSLTPAGSSSCDPPPKRRTPIINKLDPVMLIPLKKKDKIWNFVRPGGSRVAFNVETLVDFMLASGDFADPETRIAFSDADLEEIDRLVSANGFQKASVLAARHNPQKYADVKFRRDALEGIERCAGDVITDMLNTIECADPDEAQMHLMIVDLPLFSDYYHQLRDADSAYAKNCMESWVQFIEGPPNKPHRDPYGLIAFLKRFLRNLENAGFDNGGYRGMLTFASGGRFEHVNDVDGDY
jgi:hypothetical protein